MLDGKYPVRFEIFVNDSNHQYYETSNLVLLRYSNQQLLIKPYDINGNNLEKKYFNVNYAQWSIEKSGMKKSVPINTNKTGEITLHINVESKDHVTNLHRYFNATVYDVNFKIVSPWSTWDETIDFTNNDYDIEFKINVSPPLPPSTLMSNNFYVDFYNNYNFQGGYRDFKLQNSSSFTANENNSQYTVIYKSLFLKKVGVISSSNPSSNEITYSSWDRVKDPNDSSYDDSNAFDQEMASIGYKKYGSARDLGDFSKNINSASINYLTHAGNKQFYLGLESRKSSIHFVADQVKWLYYSGHGHHNSAKLGAVDGDFSPLPNLWKENLDFLIIAGCSVLDIKDYRAESFKDDYETYAYWQLMGGAWSPGKIYEESGPKMLIGYCWKAPSDKQGAVETIKEFISQYRLTKNVSFSWKRANDNPYGRNACVIDCSIEPHEFWYWDERTAAPVWSKVTKGSSDWIGVSKERSKK
jgi:hypothetical protein